jgi:hypothetical protein
MRLENRPGDPMTPTASFRRSVPPWRRGAGIITPVFWAFAAAAAR